MTKTRISTQQFYSRIFNKIILFNNKIKIILVLKIIKMKKLNWWLVNMKIIYLINKIKIFNTFNTNKILINIIIKIKVKNRKKTIFYIIMLFKKITQINILTKKIISMHLYHKIYQNLLININIILRKAKLIKKKIKRKNSNYIKI